MLPRPLLAAAMPLASLLALLHITPAAAATPAANLAPPVPQLVWADCGGGFECATARVPLDYDHPRGKTIELPLIRKPASDPAHRIGHLFFHQGGTGRNVQAIRAFPPFIFDLFPRFDFIGFDQRGSGQSQPAIVSCGPHPAFVSPFPTPQAIDERAFLEDVSRYARRCKQRNREILPHLSSANVARDLDLLRAAVGDDKLSYFGVSFGTTVGATYASLFPGRARALLLDSAMDVDGYLRRPVSDWREYAAAHEEVLGRFLAACAANPVGCGFGDGDPERALERLLARLERQPLPSPDPEIPGTLTAEHVRIGMATALRRRVLWPVFAAGLAQADAGDPTLLLDFVGASVEPDVSDDFLTSLYAVDQDYPRLSPRAYFKLAERSYADFPHFWFTSGYPDLVHALWPVEDRDAYRGPIRIPDGAAPALVIGMTHDPATPYVQAQRLTADLGNARLLTFDADGHFAVGALDPCVVGHALAYLEDQTLPPRGTVCMQQGEPFPAPADSRELRRIERTQWMLPVPRRGR